MRKFGACLLLLASWLPAHAQTQTPPIYQTDISQFFNTSQINREYRTMIGGAVAMDGVFGSSQNDWLGQLALQSYNGGPGVYQNCAWTVVCILNNPAGSWETIAGPHSALIVGEETLNNPAGSTVYPLGLVVVNNALASNVAAWGLYLEAHRVSANAGQTYGMEIDVRNSSSSVTGWTPNSTPGIGTIGMELACGAGLSATGQFPCTTAAYIAANPVQFGAGIIFLAGSVGTYGPGGTIEAIGMPYNYSLEWFSATGVFGAMLSSDANNNFLMGTNGGHLYVNNQRVWCGQGANSPC